MSHKFLRAPRSCKEMVHKHWAAQGVNMSCCTSVNVIAKPTCSFKCQSYNRHCAASWIKMRMPSLCFWLWQLGLSVLKLYIICIHLSLLQGHQLSDQQISIHGWQFTFSLPSLEFAKNEWHPAKAYIKHGQCNLVIIIVGKCNASGSLLAHLSLCGLRNSHKPADCWHWPKHPGLQLQEMMYNWAATPKPSSEF